MGKFSCRAAEKMYKSRRRRTGIALPSGRHFSFNQADFSKGNSCAVDKYSGTYIEQDNVQSPAIRAEDSQGGTLGRERRSSTCSMTHLPLAPERKRKSSLLSSSRSQGNMMRHDIESHFTVILGSPAVGKTGMVKLGVPVPYRIDEILK